jgi:outer membrane protein assembly factor BamD
MVFSKVYVRVLAVLALAALLTSCGRKKYENPITKDTQQPDKVLFDKAINDIEHGRYEVARLTLNTMINTYDTSEYLAKAKLAVADSWYREGGAHGLAQAEAEYKDFILFYPTMEEAAESQWKVCQIHVKQMEKADRDATQGQRAEDECRQVISQFPNSKYVERAKQELRKIQEVLAEKEYGAGAFYVKRQAFPAAANRLSYVVDQYPNYSQADEALWQLGYSYSKLGDRWEDRAAQAYSRIVKDYPLSPRAEDAKQKLIAMKRPVPEADPAAVAHMKYEQEHQTHTGMMGHVMGPIERAMSHSPDTRAAAHSGNPAMETLRPPTPISVPNAAPAGTPGTSGGALGISQASGGDIDTKPDARAGGAPAAAASAAGAPAAGAAVTGSTPDGAAPTAGTDGAKPATANAQQGALPTNYQTINKKQKQQKPKKPKKNAVNPPASPTPAGAAAAASDQPATGTPATGSTTQKPQ